MDESSHAIFARFFGGFPDIVRQASTTLAKACAVDGRLDNARLDEHQVSAYELALSYAEYRAALVAWESMAGPASDLQRALSAVYVATAIQSIRVRLEPLLLALGIEPLDFDHILGGKELRSVLQFCLDPNRLADIGRRVIEVQADVGEIELDDDKTMMQTAFRRLADDIVAPRAESIHRQDLTVPEEILQPMREMGVFGISVPQQYGGTAPDDCADNLSMIVVTEALSEASLAAAGSLITRPEILTRALLTGGSESQRVEWLPRIASGDVLCSIAITEPD